ncbi:MAG: hypothetical protein ACREKL_04020 [Chthoniobacterales bacterium]
MKLKDIKDVLTFAAFRPEPDDGTATWIRRFPNRRTLLLNVGKNKTTWRALGRGGRLLEAGSQTGDFKDIASGMAPEWRRLTDDGWCSVSVNSRYIISLEGNLPRKEGIEDIMRTTPRAALGSKFERNKRYALTSNPEHATSIVLSCDEEVIKKIETSLAEAGLQAGRICCGAYTMLRRAIEHANSSEPHKDAAAKSIIYMICCEGSICILTQTGDVWSELRSRSDFYEADSSPVLEMLAAGRRGGDSQPDEVLFAADDTGSDIPEKLEAQFRGTKITDLTQPDHLWALLADLH